MGSHPAVLSAYFQPCAQGSLLGKLEGSDVVLETELMSATCKASTENSATASPDSWLALPLRNMLQLSPVARQDLTLCHRRTRVIPADSRPLSYTGEEQLYTFSIRSHGGGRCKQGTSVLWRTRYCCGRRCCLAPVKRRSERLHFMGMLKPGLDWWWQGTAPLEGRHL